MKIDSDTETGSLQGISRSSSAGRERAARGTSHASEDTTDKVEISGRDAEVERLKAGANEIPEVDEEKVARIRQALESGTYAVDSKAVARSILKHHLSDEIS